MTLPIAIDFPAMEAETAREIPLGPDWQYEPKWDGFRCLAFRDHDDIEMMSKSSQPLARYFPEVRTALAAITSEKYVLDGELIIADNRSLDFDALLQRIHPAESRIKKLSTETPALFVVFDLLVNAEGADVTAKSLRERRLELESFAKSAFHSNHRLRLSPYTCNFEEAKSWFHEMAGSLDGVIAKRVDLPYGLGQRNAMLKIKNLRSADCVIGGFRYGSKAKQVGSLLLGLYDDEGRLHHVGFTSGIAASQKKDLTAKLEAIVAPPGFTGAAPGGPSRWSTERSVEWQPLKPELVIEVQYDHFSGHRFRHGTRILRWRPDKAPSRCTLSQVRAASLSPIDLLDRL